jgi:hypothetical protein
MKKEVKLYEVVHIVWEVIRSLCVLVLFVALLTIMMFVVLALFDEVSRFMI